MSQGWCLSQISYYITLQIGRSFFLITLIVLVLFIVKFYITAPKDDDLKILIIVQVFYAPFLPCWILI